MAITIHNIPDVFSPSDNPLTYDFSSDQTAQPNFSYLVKVLINAGITTEHKIFPENGIYAHFDIQEVVKSILNLPTLTASLAGNASNYCTISISVSEVYGATPVVVTTVTSSQTIAFKSRLDDLDFIDWTFADNYFMTDFPQTEKYYVGYEEFLQLNVANNGIADTITIELFDASDVSITSVTKALDANFDITQMNLTPASLVLLTALTQANFDASAYFVISTDAAGITDTITYWMDASCGMFDSYRVMFASRLGGYESFTFRLLSRDTTTTKSKGYEKAFGSWVGNEFVYSKSNGRNVDFQTMSEDMLMINSDWIPGDVQNWLMENLFESPVVYLQKNNGDSIRVNVKNKGGTKKNRVNDTLFNQVVELKYSNQRKSFLN